MAKLRSTGALPGGTVGVSVPESCWRPARSAGAVPVRVTAGSPGRAARIVYPRWGAAVSPTGTVERSRAGIERAGLSGSSFAAPGSRVRLERAGLVARRVELGSASRSLSERVGRACHAGHDRSARAGAPLDRNARPPVTEPDSHRTMLLCDRTLHECRLVPSYRRINVLQRPRARTVRSGTSLQR